MPHDDRTVDASVELPDAEPFLLCVRHHEGGDLVGCDICRLGRLHQSDRRSGHLRPVTRVVPTARCWASPDEDLAGKALEERWAGC